MSLMLRLLSITLILSSFAYAQSASDKVAEFLDDKFSENPRFSSLDVKVSEVVPLKDVKGWSAFIVDVDATLKSSPKNPVKQRMIWFSDGNVITKDLIDMYTGASLIENVKPKFQDSYYKRENLIYGNANAKHKVAIFSDPLCPFCKRFVPKAIKDMKKEPNKFAVYYYHFPLNRIHPASVTLVKAAVAAELKGYKNIVLNLYNVQVSPRQRDEQKILDAFNKAEGTHITLQDLQNSAVTKRIKEDFDVANALMVNGTPTLYFDSEIDRTKKKYLKVK